MELERDKRGLEAPDTVRSVLSTPFSCPPLMVACFLKTQRGRVSVGLLSYHIAY